MSSITASMTTSTEPEGRKEREGEGDSQARDMQ
jgi:hypothetical protein